MCNVHIIYNQSIGLLKKKEKKDGKRRKQE